MAIKLKGHAKTPHPPSYRDIPNLILFSGKLFDGPLSGPLSLQRLNLCMDLLLIRKIPNQQKLCQLVGRDADPDGINREM